MSGPADDRPPWNRALAVVAAVGPPLTVATSLLVYFGWARAQEQARWMGLDASLFGYSAQDYVLLSIQGLFVPLTVLLVAAVAWLAADRLLRGAIDRGTMKGRILAASVAGTAFVAGLLLAVAMLVLSLVQPVRSAISAPLFMALGILVSAWGIRLRRHADPAKAAAVPPEQRAVEATALLALVTVLLFWGTSQFAQAVGRGQALELQRSVGLMPRAEVFSTKPLGLSAPGVAEGCVGEGADRLYHYDGLRLLLVSGGRVFLLPNGWTAGAGTAVVLPDDATIRIEYGNGPGPAPPAPCGP